MSYFSGLSVVRLVESLYNICSHGTKHAFFCIHFFTNDICKDDFYNLRHERPF